MTMETSAGAIILSGGKNSRMGRNKAFLELGQKRIIDGVVEKLTGYFQEIVVVTNDPSAYQYLGVKVTSDIIPGLGPLSGMHAGLKVSGQYYNLILACDMPFISAELGRYLVAEADGFDVAVPQVGKYLQPLFAVYAQSCLPLIEDCLHRGISKIITFYPQVKINYVGQERLRTKAPDLERVFLNVNTPQELERARSWDQEN